VPIVIHRRRWGVLVTRQPGRCGRHRGRRAARSDIGVRRHERHSADVRVGGGIDCHQVVRNVERLLDGPSHQWYRRRVTPVEERQRRRSTFQGCTTATATRPRCAEWQIGPTPSLVTVKCDTSCDVCVARVRTIDRARRGGCVGRRDRLRDDDASVASSKVTADRGVVDASRSQATLGRLLRNPTSPPGLGFRSPCYMSGC
jgi:hypothetical protein